jgi:phosphoribosylaminoimidazole-succinocarboxamide synthase
MQSVLLQTSLPGLEILSRGKVRDIYALSCDPSLLLFVATDRISAFDVIIQNVKSAISDLLDLSLDLP